MFYVIGKDEKVSLLAVKYIVARNHSKKVRKGPCRGSLLSPFKRSNICWSKVNASIKSYRPSNVLLNEFGMLKLWDFGLAKKIVDLVQNDNESQKPKSGTPYYMAPELFQDGGVYSFSSDFWSLGWVLYELATGKPPFSASGLKELISEILFLEAKVQKVEGFSASFHDLLSKLLEKDPLKRISWEQLRKHPFWEEEISQRVLPSQPQFDKYIKSKGYSPEEFYQQQEKNSYFIPKISAEIGPSKADVMRLSITVKISC